MSLLHELKQTPYGEKGIEFLAVCANQLESIGHDDLADKIRDHNYGRQMKRLETYLGQTVHVHSSVDSMLYVVETGRLVDVWPFWAIRIKYVEFESHGLPFISHCAIKKIFNDDEEVLYFNPYIGPDWMEKHQQMSRDELMQFRRKVFGKSGLLKVGEVERKSL